jgi:hypothetical protein
MTHSTTFYDRDAHVMPWHRCRCARLKHLVIALISESLELREVFRERLVGQLLNQQIKFLRTADRSQLRFRIRSHARRAHIQHEDHGIAAEALIRVCDCRSELLCRSRPALRQTRRRFRTLALHARLDVFPELECLCSRFMINRESACEPRSGIVPTSRLHDLPSSTCSVS